MQTEDARSEADSRPDSSPIDSIEGYTYIEQNLLLYGKVDHIFYICQLLPHRST